MQHDEALVTPYAALSQMSEGLRWLRATFDATVDIGYQIDPFGHSALTPVVFRALGFRHAGTRSPHHTLHLCLTTTYTVVNRIDWRKKRSMGSAGAKEFMWSANANDSQADALLTHLVHDHYSSRADADGFDWERRSKPIDAHNVATRAKLFAGAVT